MNASPQSTQRAPLDAPHRCSIETVSHQEFLCGELAVPQAVPPLEDDAIGLRQES
jgi:hypothetical protein